MKLGNIVLPGPLRLAPMAGYSNVPFRLVCKELGSSLTTSEEIYAEAVVYGGERAQLIAAFSAQEKPIAMQLLGADPAVMAEAARILVGRGADIIDLNLGCPVPKITLKGAGSALMREPAKAAAVFRAVRRAVSVPVTAKLRGGWDDATMNAPEIARIAEAEGLDGLAVHPRSQAQRYYGHAPWDVIRQVVDAVTIPVTGNGDVRDHDDALAMMRETGCQGVMIGRGALGRPWVFCEGLDTLGPAAQHAFKLGVIERHMTLIREHFLQPHKAFMQMKVHLARYAQAAAGLEFESNRLFAYDHPDALWADFLQAYSERARFVALPI